MTTRATLVAITSLSSESSVMVSRTSPPSAVWAEDEKNSDAFATISAGSRTPWRWADPPTALHSRTGYPQGASLVGCSVAWPHSGGNSTHLEEPLRPIGHCHEQALFRRFSAERGGEVRHWETHLKIKLWQCRELVEGRGKGLVGSHSLPASRWSK